MLRIRVEVPGPQGSTLVDLAEGEGIVFGRAPDRARLREIGVAKLREHVVAAPSVSSTHAMVWFRDRQVHLRDLGSRNGSWLRLSQDHETQVGVDDEVHVRLGFPAPSSGHPPPVEPARYEDEGEFGASISRAVQSWLAQQDAATRVRTAGREAPTGAVSFPLANGEHLVIEAERTVDDRFHDLMVPIARYVATQNAVYAAEVETRNDGMILGSEAIRQVHRRVVEAAMESSSRIILLGPSGTGKERLARAYHRHLGCGGSLVTVNCATLTRERIVADLFGAEAGAYTGAQRTIVGAVERADGGTLFLDEIGEMPLDVQSQLLRFLDTGEYQRLGATGVTRTATVNVVAATNRNLRAMVNDGSFRLDLFFRLALEVIDVPALRERFKDVTSYLASKQLEGCSALDALQPAALEQLRHHAWPGNFRELVNFVQRLPRNATRGSIDVDTIRRFLSAGALAVADAPAPSVDQPPSGDWLDWVRAAAAAYDAENGTTGPRTWGEMTTFVEQYLKPFALVHMAGVANAQSSEAIAVSKVADSLKADRGTVIKQLRRYFESRT